MAAMEVPLVFAFKRELDCTSAVRCAISQLPLVAVSLRSAAAFEWRPS